MEEKSRDDMTLESSTNQRQGVGQVQGDDSGQVASSDAVPAVPSTPKRRLAEFPFPIKLHIVLGEIEDEGLSSIMSWQPDGKCFMIHKAKDVVGSVLSRWFRQQSIGSFQRQLNLYDFKRIKMGENKGAYFHELFQRDNRRLAYGIKRENLKSYKHDLVTAGTFREPRMIQSQSMILDVASIPRTIPRTTSDPQPFAFVNNSLHMKIKARGRQFDDGGLHSALRISQELVERKQRTSMSMSFPQQPPRGATFGASGFSWGANHESEQNIAMNGGRRRDDSKVKNRGLLSSLITAEAASSPTQPEPRLLRPLPSSDTALVHSTRNLDFDLEPQQHNLQQGQEVVLSQVFEALSKEQAQGLSPRVSTDLFSPDVQDDIIETFLHHGHV